MGEKASHDSVFFIRHSAFCLPPLSGSCEGLIPPALHHTNTPRLPFPLLPLVRRPRPLPSRLNRPNLSSMASVLESAELMDCEDQTAFNLAVWEKVLADSSLAALPYRIETDRFGQIVMSPPPAPEHGEGQFGVGERLHQLLPAGHVITECPVRPAKASSWWMSPGFPRRGVRPSGAGFLHSGAGNLRRNRLPEQHSPRVAREEGALLRRRRG